MGALVNTIGGLSRPLVLGLVILIGFGYLNAEPGTGVKGADGFACRGFTNDAELNRMICRFHPARLWNMPITEVLPFLAPKEAAAD